ncbi:MAG: hypothetical protein Aurels2KO_43380 [Aureliella sp.]
MRLKKVRASHLILLAVAVGYILLGWWALYRPSPWVWMEVNVPDGETPEEIFSELCKAVSREDWETAFGCLTMDSRKELVETMLLDAHYYVVCSDNEPGGTGDVLNELEMSIAQDCKRLFDEYGITGRYPWKDSWKIADPAKFVGRAWQVLSYPNGPVLDEREQLGQVKYGRYTDDHAYAPIETSFRRQGRVQYYVHFKQRSGKWLIDEGPWWITWGTHTGRRGSSSEDRTITGVW